MDLFINSSPESRLQSCIPFTQCCRQIAIDRIHHGLMAGFTAELVWLCIAEIVVWVKRGIQCRNQIEQGLPADCVTQSPFLTASTWWPLANRTGKPAGDVWRRNTTALDCGLWRRQSLEICRGTSFIQGLIEFLVITCHLTWIAFDSIKKKIHLKCFWRLVVFGTCRRHTSCITISRLVLMFGHENLLTGGDGNTKTVKTTEWGWECVKTRAQSIVWNLNLNETRFLARIFPRLESTECREFQHKCAHTSWLPRRWSSPAGNLQKWEISGKILDELWRPLGKGAWLVNFYCKAVGGKTKIPQNAQEQCNKTIGTVQYFL